MSTTNLNDRAIGFQPTDTPILQPNGHTLFTLKVRGATRLRHLSGRGRVGQRVGACCSETMLGKHGELGCIDGSVRISRNSVGVNREESGIL
jgi:hypothetical protein